MAEVGTFLYKESGIRIVSYFSIVTLEITVLIVIIIFIRSNYIIFTVSKHYFRGIFVSFFDSFILREKI